MAIRLFDLFNLALSVLMWLLNVIFSSKVIPTYFTDDVGSSLRPFNLMLILGILAFFFLKNINSVFVELSEILFASSQLLSDFRSRFSLFALFLFDALLFKI